MSRPAVVGVAGRSGSGKTSLLELLIPRLASRGLAVGGIKHTSHGFLAHRPGKDSYRLYESGATSVALISREQLATFTRRSGDVGPDVSLDTALASLPDNLDLVLVEGFSWEPIPRFVLVPDSESPIPEHLARGEVLRIVEVSPQQGDRKPEFPRALVESLADAIELRVRQGRANLQADDAAEENEADLSTGGG
jgi:molybdopterin-guanine dinucleotide biosynthesis protein B